MKADPNTVDFAPAPLEIATGLVFGNGRQVPLAVDERPGSPLEALEQAILPALSRAPCLVSFSGGRDSACVLAVATQLAHREGLAPPIPATNRFLDAPGADESHWQERVVTSLGLDDWLRFELGDELDAVGPIAQRVLRRHGLLWPFNVHFHVPLLEAAGGGSLLTGIGGDEVFGESRWARANAVLARDVRPTGRDVLRVSTALSPAVLRRAVLRRRSPTGMPWLRPAGRRAFTRAWAAQAAGEPRKYEARLRWWHGLRSVQVGFHSLALLAEDARTALVHPFADVSLACALADASPTGGPVDRGHFLRFVFGDLLPEDVYHRHTKAQFDAAFWGRYARGVAERWNGEAADPHLVDAEGVRAAWAADVPDSHTLTLLQAAWLAMDGSRTDDASRLPAGASGRSREAPSTREAGAAPTRAVPRT